MNMPPTVSPQEWTVAREELLVKEKELVRARDALAAERRRMPRMAVEKDYRFEGPDGPVRLLDLFEGRRQLIVYRFFFEPGVAKWPESGCPGCSFMADQVSHLAHINARDTTFVNASRAPQADIERYRARMGWAMPWYTITDDWDADFGVDEWHGTNAFYPRRRRDDLPHVLRRQPRRRGPGHGLDLPRHHRARPPGDVGGLPRGLPADRALRVVEPARRIREAGDMIAHVGGIPVEETLPTLLGTGGALIVARAWLSLHLRRHRDHARVTENLELRIERTFAAPIERVFDAWTSAEVIRRWWQAEVGWETSEAEVDLRIGGAVRVVMRDTEGGDHGGGGVYTEIDRPTPPGLHLDLGRRHARDADRTRLLRGRRRHPRSFKHSGLWSEETVRSHEGGWGRILDNLERMLAASS